MLIVFLSSQVALTVFGSTEAPQLIFLLIKIVIISEFLARTDVLLGSNDDMLLIININNLC